MFFYDIGISLYSFFAKVISPFDKKAALFVKGRKGIFKKISRTIEHDRPIIWVHCASVGEFEQAIPLIERIRVSSPDKRILVTFFSPSGYELRKDYYGADYVFYLPLDKRLYVRLFLNTVRPEVAIFIKYEYWYHYLTSLKSRKVPTYLVSAIISRKQIFFKWYGKFMRRVFRCYNTIFVQDEKSRVLLNEIGVFNVVVAGDTRFDRVNQIAHLESPKDEIISSFASNRPLWVAGSTWKEDEWLIAKSLDEIAGSKVIIVPHEVSDERICEVKNIFNKYKTLIYSQCLNDANLPLDALSGAQVLIIDTIGMLSRLYKYGLFAYIGGGFGRTGIHNILEAAIYGCPTVFGPVYQEYKEACDLIEEGGAKSVSTCTELSPILKEWISSPDKREQASDICKNYINNHLGATEIVLKSINI